jgi:hypothetical protein
MDDKTMPGTDHRHARGQPPDRHPVPAMRPAPDGGLPGTIRRLERRLGIYRPGRSPWVWILGPGLNAGGTAAVVLWLAHDDLGWVITAPLAVLSGLVMGAMAWAFMGTSWDQEEDERAAAALHASRRTPTPTTVSAPDLLGDRSIRRACADVAHRGCVRRGRA